MFLQCQGIRTNNFGGKTIKDSVSLIFTLIMLNFLNFQKYLLVPRILPLQI